MLCDLLLDRFIHRSHWEPATDDSLLRRVCSEHRPASLLILRPYFLLERVRGELLNLLVPFV